MGDRTTPIPSNQNASDASVGPDIDDGVTSRSNGKAPRQDGDRPVLPPVSEEAPPPETSYLAPSASESRSPLMGASDPMREDGDEAASSPRFPSRSSSISSSASAAARRTRKILGLGRQQARQQQQPSSLPGSVNGGIGGGDRGGSSGTNPLRKVSFSSKGAPGALPFSNGGNTSETQGTPGEPSLGSAIEAAEQALVAAAHATSRPKQQGDALARVATAPGEPQLAGVGEQDRKGGVLSSSLLGRPAAAAGGGVSHAYRPIAGGAEPFVSRREGIRNGDESNRANEETGVSGENGSSGVSRGNRGDTSVVPEAREIKPSKESVDAAVAAAALSIGLVEASAMPVGAGVGSEAEMGETAAAAAARVEREGGGGTHAVRSESSPIPRILPRMGRPAHAGNRSGLGREGDLVEEGFARARGLAKEIRPLMSVKLAAELGGLLRQAIVGDWHTCAMPVSVPPRSKIQERAEWDAWVASEGVSRKEAMKVFTAAVDELYRQKFVASTSTTANNTSGISTSTTASTPGGPESQHPLDLSLGPLIHGFRRDTGVARNRRRGSTGGSTLTLPNTSQGGIGMGMSISSSGDRGGLDQTVKQKALAATPVFSGRAAAAPGQEDAGVGGESRASALEAGLERVGGKPGVALVGVGDAEDEGRVFAGGALTGGGGGDGGELDRRDMATAFAAAMTVGQSEAEDTLKTGILYKKREVLPGWRPRTFIVDKRQRLLRYYLPSSAKPRGSIPLEGCSVGLTVASTDGRGEPGPDGTRLFRIRLVAGPHLPTTPRGNNTSSRFGVYGVNGSESYGKTYTLAATSFEDAQAWVAAIKAGSDWTPTISNGLVVDRSSERSRELRTQGSPPSGTREPLLNEGVPSVPVEASSRGGLVEVLPLSRSVGDASGDLGGPRGGAIAAPGTRSSRNENDVHASGGGSSSRTMQRRSTDPSGENTRSCAGVLDGGARRLSGFGARGEPWTLSSLLRGNVNPYSSSPPFLWKARGGDGREASSVPSVRLRLLIVSTAVAFGLAGVLASTELRAMSHGLFSAALERLTRASLPLAWFWVAAIGISAVVAAAAERTRLLREKRSLLQMLRDLDSPGTSVSSNERYFARFWVDVQPLQTELERIRRRGGSPEEFEGPGRHAAQRSPSAPVTILHLVMKAAASAIAKNRTSERLATQALGSGGATTTKVACVAAAAGTLTRAARKGATESAQGGHSGDPPVVVFVEGAEGKSAAKIAAEVERAAGATTAATKSVSRASVAPPSPRLLRADKVPLLPPGTYASLAQWRLLDGTTAAGGVLSTGTAATQRDLRRLRQLRRRAADCLVEIGPQQQQRASFATIPAVFGKTGPPSPADLKPDGRKNTLGAEMIPDPGGEEAGAPLRVTIRRAGALVGDRGVVCAGGTNVPVIALEVSVVGDATQGNSGTEDFARALRKLLRFAGPG